MQKKLRCLVTNNEIKLGEWYWYSWEMEAPISASGMADIEMRRHEPDDEFAKILWEEWIWSKEIGQPDL
jgi:hypothetical protein